MVLNMLMRDIKKFDKKIVVIKDKDGYYKHGYFYIKGNSLFLITFFYYNNGIVSDSRSYYMPRDIKELKEVNIYNNEVV